MQHRTMSIRQHEAVAVDPVRIGRIMTIVLTPQCDGDFRHSHRHAGMSGIGFLNGIHCQHANRVGHCVGWEHRSHGNQVGGGTFGADSKETKRVAAKPGILPDCSPWLKIRIHSDVVKTIDLRELCSARFAPCGNARNLCNPESLSPDAALLLLSSHVYRCHRPLAG